MVLTKNSRMSFINVGSECKTGTIFDIETKRLEKIKKPLFEYLRLQNIEPISIKGIRYGSQDQKGNDIIAVIIATKNNVVTVEIDVEVSYTPKNTITHYVN